MSIPDVLGVSGFCLSILIILWNVCQYYRGLSLYIRALEVTQLSEHRFLVSFQMVFLNRSSHNKHVFHMGISYPRWMNGKILEPERWRVREDKDTLQVADADNNVTEYPIDTVLELPLDIPPHQFQNKVYPLLLILDDEDLEPLVVNIPFRIDFRALNDKRKSISKISIRTSLSELTTEGLFSTSH